MFAVSAGGEVAAEVGVASLSVHVLSLALRSQGDPYGREGSKREKGWRQHSFFFWGNVVCANQRRAPAALSFGVVGAGGVFLV